MVIIVNTSCKKENLLLDISTENTKEFLSFQNYKEFSEILNKVHGMNYEEIKSWEESNGFKSYGRTCDELYASIKPEMFNTIEEVRSFVKEYSDYFALVEDEYGDMVLEASFSRSPYRYFFNTNRIFCVESNYYKVFKDGVAMTTKEKLNELKALDSPHSLDENGEIKYFPLFAVDQEIQDSKDAVYNCGTKKSEPGDNGSDRVRITIELNYLWAQETYYNSSGQPYTVNVTYIHNTAEVRPYFRRLGVWWRCTRTISCNLKVAVDFSTTLGWYRHFFYQSESGKNDWALEYVMQGITLSGHVYPIMHFGGYDCWGRTPSGGGTYVEIECNSHLF